MTLTLKTELFVANTKPLIVTYPKGEINISVYLSMSMAGESVGQARLIKCGRALSNAGARSPRARTPAAAGSAFELMGIGSPQIVK